MGRYDDLLSDIQPSQNSTGKYDDLVSDLKPSATAKKPTSSLSSWPSRISKFVVHPVIEGGSMGVAGTAAGIMAAPASPMASAVAAPAAAIAMYPIAHNAANAVDRMIGVPAIDESVGKALQEGAQIEAGGRVLGKIPGMISKIPFAKAGEGLGGSPASNFSRTFKKGYSTYSAPSVEEASAKFGAAKNDLMGNMMTPEEQAGMMINPRGEATDKLHDVMVRWLKGEEISPKDALMARQAADRVFPADTAKNATQRGGLSEFRTAMNEILGKQEEGIVPVGTPPSAANRMKQASDQYADAKLKSQMLQPLRVNKSNPNEPSKLGIMLGTGFAVDALRGHDPFWAALGALAQSPAFLGFIAASAGQLAKVLPNLSPVAQQSLAKGIAASFNAQVGSGANK